MPWNRMRHGALWAVLCPATLLAQNVVTTIAGVDPTFTGDGQPALSTPLGYVNGVAADGAGNIYFTDPLEHLVLRVGSNGTLSVFAGNGIAGYSGDGGPATSASIAAADSPLQYVRYVFFPLSLGGIAIDPLGNVYFGDSHRVRMVNPQGIITTVAGGGSKTASSVTPATTAALGIVGGLAFDGGGNLYFTESNRVRMLTPEGVLSTYAGSLAAGFSGDDGQASAALMTLPLGLVFDAAGNLYVADGNTLIGIERIRKITPAGVISTIAGGGTVTPANGVPPLNLDLPQNGGLAVNAAGALYAFSPYGGLLIQLSGTTAGAFTTTTLITSPVLAPFTPNVQASTAYLVGMGLFDNSGIAFDAAGNLYVADSRDGYLCKIDTSGFLTTVAGNGGYGFGGDGGAAPVALIQGPTSMTQTPDGTIYFIDSLNARVRGISPGGVINSVLSPANFAPLGKTEVINAITSDSNANLYVLLAGRLIELSPSGAITILVNNAGTRGDSGDNGPASAAEIQSGGGLVRDGAGDLYFTDPISCRIREVTVDGNIHTIAGTGVSGFTPDGALASGSPLAAPTSLLLDGLGGIYFEELPTGGVGHAIIRYITPGGILKTIAGNGSGGFSGDRGPAVDAGLMLLQRTGLVLDKLGNLFLADGFNSRVRMISPGGIINTFAGNGLVSNAGDGGPPLSASLVAPEGLFFDAQGDLLVSDVAGNRIRSVLAAPPGISVSPGDLAFSANANGIQTPPQRLTVESPVSGVAFSIAASAGANWLVLSATAGLTPQEIHVLADPTGLAPGPYSAILTITSPLTIPQSVNIPVSFQVAPAGSPKLAIDKTGLSFTFPRNPSTTLTQMIRVGNAGSGSLAYSAQALGAADGSWLKVSPASGSVTPNAPAHLTVTANPGGLAAGTYTGLVTISSSTTGETDVVRVDLTVSSLDQAIKLSHSGLSFISVSGGGIVPPARFGVANIGRGAMNFTVSSSTLSGGQQWLSASPASSAATSGSPATPVVVTVNQSGLEPGFYYGLVRIDSPGAANSPQVVTVAMHVLDSNQDPGPMIVPNELVVNAVQGAPPPSSQNLFVYNISSTPLTYVSSLFASNANDQFLFTPDNALLSLKHSTRLVVQPLTSGLPVGVYDATLTLQFSDGNLRRVRIRTVISQASPASAASAPSEAGHATAACTPTQLIPVITNLGESFGVPAAWPVALEAQVQDDCGNTLNSGSVTASFSNGDPPLGLVPVLGGMWQATWQSGNSAGPVTLTVTAFDPALNLTGTREVTGGLGALSPAPVLGAAVNAASFAGNTPLSPRSIISLFGQGLANGTAAAGTLPLGNTLAGATVVMAGTELPLIYAADGQVNAVMNAAVNVDTSQQIVLQRDNTLSLPISVDVSPAEPAIFGYPAPGDPATQGAIVNAITYVVAQPAAPVAAGDIIAIYCTGLGAVNLAVPDGAGAPSSPLARATVTPTVTIGGQNAAVSFAGLSPGFVGLYQIDAAVPAGLTPGNAVPVIVSSAGAASPPATMAVK